jgi:hypothetical protein
MTRKVLCLFQALFSCIVLYGLFLLRPLLTKSPDCRSAIKGCTLPVLLVHPALHNAASWYVYQSALRKQGYAVYYFEYSCRERSLDAVAARLAREVEAVAARHAL